MTGGVIPEDRSRRHGTAENPDDGGGPRGGRGDAWDVLDDADEGGTGRRQCWRSQYGRSWWGFVAVRMIVVRSAVRVAVGERPGDEVEHVI